MVSNNIQLSPILMQRIDTQKTGRIQAANLPDVQEGVKNGSKNKKILLCAAGAAAIGAAVTGGILLHKRSQAKALLMEADEAFGVAKGLKVKSKQALDWAKEQIDEVAALIKEGEKCNYDDVFDESGHLLRRFETEIIDGVEMPSYLEEFAKDGTLLRKTTIENEIKDNAREFNLQIVKHMKDGTYNATSTHNCKEGEKLIPRRVATGWNYKFDNVQNRFSYDCDGNLNLVEKDVKLFSDRFETGFEIQYCNNEIDTIGKNIIQYDTGTLKTGREFMYDEEGVLDNLKRNFHMDENGNMSCKDFYVTDNKGNLKPAGVQSYPDNLDDCYGLNNNPPDFEVLHNAGESVS